ncbi:MAG TPA: AI-2E family transporter [Ktedonobacteraceae bacterium]
MAPDTTDTAQKKTSTEPVHSGHGARRKLIAALTVLAFLAIIAVALYATSLIAGAVVLLLLSALLAYLIYPLVEFLQRRLRRAMAITVAYLLIAGVMTGVMFLVTSALIQQSTSLAQSVRFLLSPAGKDQIRPLIDFLGKLGVTSDQVAQYKNQLLSQVLGVLSGLIPFLNGVIGNVISLIVVTTLSVYFVIDGPRIIHWLRFKTPVTSRDTIAFLLQALDQSLGGYFRGSLLIALIGALCVGAGLALLGVPYSAFLGLLFFLLYFLPVVGAYVIGVLCILAALPQGWEVTLAVAVYITVLQGVVIGHILSPRIFSKTVGLHPIIALFALFAGAELFGLLGGLLAIPVAGVLQQIIVALWKRWKSQHPEQFPPEGSSYG